MFLFSWISGSATASPVSTVQTWQPELYIPVGSAVSGLHEYKVGVMPGEAFEFKFRPGGLASGVELGWVHQTSGTTVLEHFATGYYVTAVCHANAHNEIYVAGKDRGGATRIEKWTLQQPNVLSITPIGGGPAVIELQNQGLGSIQAILLVSEEGLDVITAMSRMVDSADILVKFNDNNNVYRIDPTVRPATLLLVASESATVGAPITSLSLGGLHTVIRPMRIVDGTANGQPGYYFTNARERGAACVMTADTSTGVIDTLIPIDGVEDWVLGGFADPANYLPVN